MVAEPWGWELGWRFQCLAGGWVGVAPLGADLSLLGSFLHLEL